MLKHYITLLLLVFSLSVFGQVTVQFIPELYGRNVDGLFRCSMINSGPAVSASLSITVKERKAGTVCTIKTTQFNIPPGNNFIPFSTARGAAIQFANNSTGRLTSTTRAFPEGDYEYCYTVNFTRADLLPTEQCFDYLLAPFAELNLIDPYDKDKICDVRPLLTWQPLIPGVAGSAYQLVLAEVKEGQNPTEALNYNLPVINQRSIISPVLPYPSIAPALEKGKTYAWQVTAYKDETVLNRTEIWSFKIDCQDTVKKVMYSFRDIEDLLKGNYYIAVGQIRFAVTNPYKPQDLKYEIRSISKPNQKIRHLPNVKLENGHNQITIDLGLSNSFADQDYYILTVWLPNGTVKSLRFLYQELK